jgi:hypothetical protein
MPRTFASFFTAGAIVASLVFRSSTASACTGDSQCTPSQFCNTQTAGCVSRLANGTPIPTITGHTPALAGTCTPNVGAAVCVSTVCDSDNLCGYGPGHSGCNGANAATLCRSTICSVSGVCLAPGTCAADGDCAGNQFCNTQTSVCTVKLTNGNAIPTISGHTPALFGQCTATVAPVVCSSSICDTADNACGYADGHGTCDDTTGPNICRSGVCAPTGICGSAGGCTTDPMCPAGQFCNTDTRSCVAKLANGDSIPTIAGHTPVLDGTCSSGAVGAAVCTAGLCDGDGKCGLGDAHGPCTTDNAAQVCRSGVCTPENVCKIVDAGAGGCTADVQCLSNQFCNTETKACVAKIANGEAIPTTAGHDPPLAGQCDDAAAKAVCAAGVCDASDGKCGLVDGHGPCASDNVTVVCRSGLCAGAGDTCGPAPPPSVATRSACLRDDECPAGQYCDTGVTSCKPKLANGDPLPTIPSHTPNLTGVCTAEAAQSVCISGTCDPADQRCGYLEGHGRCTDANAASVCRSKKCDPIGFCGFLDDGQLQGGGCSATGDGEAGRASLAVLGVLALAVTCRKRSSSRRCRRTR